MLSEFFNLCHTHIVLVKVGKVLSDSLLFGAAANGVVRFLSIDRGDRCGRLE